MGTQFDVVVRCSAAGRGVVGSLLSPAGPGPQRHLATPIQPFKGILNVTSFLAGPNKHHQHSHCPELRLVPRMLVLAVEPARL